MGKTSKPLTIYVTQELIHAPELQALADKGHRIVLLELSQDPEPDLILSGRAWRMTPLLLKYVEVAVRAARAQRYPGKKEEKDD